MTTLSTSTVATIALGLASAAHAQHGPWTTAVSTAPGVQYRTFQSPNADATVSFHAWLPPQYTSAPTARFPVLYWLHGSSSPIAGIPTVSSWFSTAMAQGKIPPMIIIFPNGMGASMWCDTKDGDYLMETVVIDDLIPHVDATFRTIAERRGRILEGFSMGGSGTGRLGLRRPDLFAGISMLGAGPMQLDFMTAPLGTDVPPRNRAAIFEGVWGSDPDYYLEQHPWTIAQRRAQVHITQRTQIRLGTGALDAMLPPVVDFHVLLNALSVPHEHIVIPGVAHNLALTLQGLGEAGWDFYHRALATPCMEPSDVDCSGMVDGFDLGVLLGAWGPGDGAADINGDRMIDGIDLALMVAAWGPAN
ncbi:MAG: esterase family protein [Phycisphaerae bacterium]|nr:esterase family protein [Phycisphaerae bacterium]